MLNVLCDIIIIIIMIPLNFCCFCYRCRRHCHCHRHWMWAEVYIFTKKSRSLETFRMIFVDFEYHLETLCCCVFLSSSQFFYLISVLSVHSLSIPLSFVLWNEFLRNRRIFDNIFRKWASLLVILSNMNASIDANNRVQSNRNEAKSANGMLIADCFAFNKRGFSLTATNTFFPCLSAILQYMWYAYICIIVLNNIISDYVYWYMFEGVHTCIDVRSYAKVVKKL